MDIDSSHLIVVNGVSKLYGMTGIRIGWVVAPRKLVEVMTNVQAQTTSNPSVISQAAAEGALTGVQSIVESLRLTIQNNRDVMMQEMGSSMEFTRQTARHLLLSARFQRLRRGLGEAGGNAPA